MPLTPIPLIIEELRAGRIIILVDDENRENEGDFVCAAEKVTPEIINFMTRIGGGYLCLSLTGDDCDRLDLVPQASSNNSIWGTPFTVSVDGSRKHGVGTGVSALDRVKTIQLCIDKTTTPDDFVRPGHINPLRARDGGVLVRTGQTEGSIDLCKLAGLHPSALIIEIVRPDGEMARMPDLEQIATDHEFKMCSVEQVIEHRLTQEGLVHRMDPHEGTEVRTPEGLFNLIAYRSTIDPLPHLVLTVGGIGDLDPQGAPKEIDEPVLVRMHRRNLLGDIFNDLSYPSGERLRTSLRMIQKEGRGALVYLRSEGVGEGLNDRLLKIARPQHQNVNVPDLTRTDGIAAKAQPMNYRAIGLGSQILRDLGLRKLRIITNQPRSLPGLHAFGLEIVEQVTIE